MGSTRLADLAPTSHPLLHPITRKLFSLSGVFALGVFLLVHVVVNGSALEGDTAFMRLVARIHRVPALVVVEWSLVLVPLLFHAAVGVWLVCTRAPLLERSPYSHAMRIAVRVTGIVALAFVALHLPELRFRRPGLRLDGGELSTLLAADLSSTWHGVPLRGAFYLVCTGCVTFHFAAGLWAFCVTSAPETALRARRWLGWAAAAVGFTLWAFFADIVVVQATGRALFGTAPEAVDEASEPCPPK